MLLVQRTIGRPSINPPDVRCQLSMQSFLFHSQTLHVLLKPMKPMKPFWLRVGYGRIHWAFREVPSCSALPSHLAYLAQRVLPLRHFGPWVLDRLTPWGCGECASLPCSALQATNTWGCMCMHAYSRFPIELLSRIIPDLWEQHDLQSPKVRNCRVLGKVHWGFSCVSALGDTLIESRDILLCPAGLAVRTRHGNTSNSSKWLGLGFFRGQDSGNCNFLLFSWTSIHIRVLFFLSSLGMLCMSMRCSGTIRKSMRRLRGHVSLLRKWWHIYRWNWTSSCVLMTLDNLEFFFHSNLDTRSLGSMGWFVYVRMEGSFGLHSGRLQRFGLSCSWALAALLSSAQMAPSGWRSWQRSPSWWSSWRMGNRFLMGQDHPCFLHSFVSIVGVTWCYTCAERQLAVAGSLWRGQMHCLQMLSLQCACYFREVWRKGSPQMLPPKRNHTPFWSACSNRTTLWSMSEAGHRKQRASVVCTHW